MGNSDSEHEAEKSSKETTQDKEETATAKIADNQDKEVAVAKPRRCSSRSKSNTADSTAAEPAVKMDIDDEENETSKEFRTDPSEEDPSREASDSNTNAKSQSKSKSGPAEEIGKDSEEDENGGESEEDGDSEENDGENETANSGTGKRRRGRSDEPRSMDCPGRAKRTRVKPLDRFQPEDFSAPKEKRGKPVRGRPRRSASQPKPSPAPQKKGDYITIIEGQGMKLGDIPVIRKHVEESDIDSHELYLVHRLLFSYKGRGSNKMFKTHILDYSGYMREAAEGEGEDKVAEENSNIETFMSAKVFKYKVEKLKAIMDFLHVDRSPTEEGPLGKEALIDRLLDFLCAPSLETMNPTEDSSDEGGEDSDDGDAMADGNKKEDAKTTKATEAKKDDASTPQTEAAAKTEEGTKEPKKDAETTRTAEPPKESQTSAVTTAAAETKEKPVAKPDKQKQGKVKKDAATSGDDQDEGTDRKTANSQTYQEWCKKARIEGAFYLVREHEKGDEPSDAAIRQWVQAYVTCFDVSSATAKHAIETASAKFGVNLMDRKDLIREFLISEI